MQIASEQLKGRVFEVSLADLQKVRGGLAWVGWAMQPWCHATY